MLVFHFLWVFVPSPHDINCSYYTVIPPLPRQQAAEMILNTPYSSQSSFLQAGSHSRRMGGRGTQQTRTAVSSQCGRGLPQQNRLILQRNRWTESSASAPRSYGASPPHSLHTRIIRTRTEMKQTKTQRKLLKRTWSQLNNYDFLFKNVILLLCYHHE